MGASLEPVEHLEGTSFGNALEGGVVKVLDAESGFYAGSPFKVII